MEEGPREDPEREGRWRSWMAAAQRGDRGAYGRLLEELLPFVRRVVRGRMTDPTAAEDVVSEVLLSIHTARHTYRAERPLAPWVRAIARNAVVDWARRRTRSLGRELPLEGVEPAAEESRAYPETLPLSPGLRRALETLPEAQRQAVLLLKVEGLSVAEAAERAGVSPGALKLRAHRGYRAMRALLGRDPS